MPTIATVTISSTRENPRACGRARSSLVEPSVAMLDPDRRHLRRGHTARAAEHQLHTVTDVDLPELMQGAALELHVVAHAVDDEGARLHARDGARYDVWCAAAEGGCHVQRHAQRAQCTDESVS